ncbi:hypothetical protein MMIC_P1573 [Mariprofundus micogutta]|uniref:DUF2155 domain-containing protein n=1 Tax=Mariprofundus micogutta TaxID=1921010 RepID=A0A1L8CNV2_9PROT|nr:DUF2155 domain-containing protein [Mariprofundus micogutta]GAV20602.1 hypothetical protein MMIC_P1573 [Mariprofundus micogutta]
MKKLALFAVALLMLSACEQKQAEQIEWQLPLEAQEDPHGSQNLAVVPDWAVAIPGEAELVWLEKSTTKTIPSIVSLGTATQVNGWDVQLLGLATGLRVENSAFLNDENVHNPAAFVQISKDGDIHYRGWLYQNFPELFGMDNLEWKVWLKGITLRPAS